MAFQLRVGLATDRSLDFAENFVLSSGTVAVDRPRKKVLLLYYTPKCEYLLPKGRKNVGETLSAAAIRETKEESGFDCRLIQHNLPTSATRNSFLQHSEPFAVQQRMTNSLRKIIFWYLAEADSSAMPIADLREEGEEFETRWADFASASSMITFEEDRRIVEKALSGLAVEQTRCGEPKSTLRDQYLNPEIDPSALGFVSVSLGGSAAYNGAESGENVMDHDSRTTML